MSKHKSGNRNTNRNRNKKSDDALIAKLNIIAAIVNLIITLINSLTEVLRRL